jgi:hypothetical protein
MQTYPVLSNTSSEYETTVAAGTTTTTTTTDMCGTNGQATNITCLWQKTLTMTPTYASKRIFPR